MKPIRKRRHREKITAATFFVCSTHGNGRLHDAIKGWGTVEKDGKSILWDSWRPMTKKQRAKRDRRMKNAPEAFSKIIFPVIKNCMPPDANTLRDIMLAQRMYD